MAPGRREFLQLMAGAVAASWPSRAFAQVRLKADTTSLKADSTSDTGPLTAIPLNDHLHLIAGAGGNVLLVTGPDGLVMVNGGRSERSDELLEDGGGAGGRQTVEDALQHRLARGAHRIERGARRDRRADHRARAHEAVPRRNDQFVDWQKRTYKPLPPQALPTKTFYTTGSMTVGGERLEYGHLGQAHTDGDIYVFFPASNVLVAGDVLSVGTVSDRRLHHRRMAGRTGHGEQDAARPDERRDAHRARTGPVQTRADLQAQHDMLAAMRDRFTR